MNRDISKAALVTRGTDSLQRLHSGIPMAEALKNDVVISGQSLQDHLRIRTWRSTLQSFLRDSKNILKRHGTTTREYHAMLEIWSCSDKTGPTVGALARLMRVRHNTAVDTVNGLCKKALAVRTRSADDRRVANVQLTDKGRELLSELVHEHLRELHKFADDFRKALA